MCAIFGLIDYKNSLNKEQREELIKVLSRECMERGTHATGISYIKDGNLTVFKKPKKASKMRFRLPKEANVIMGHTRHTTQGSENLNYNNHPFTGKVGGKDFAFAHNGMLYNDTSLRITEDLPKTHIETDSYVAVQLIENENSLDFDSLKFMAEKVDGSFCFTAMDQQSNLYVVKGDNPISMVKFKAGFYVYASTPEILSRALLQIKWLDLDFDVINIKEGDIVKISPDGNLVKGKFNSTSWRDTYFSPYSYRQYYDFDETEYEGVKSVANLFGYTEEDIDLMIEDGYSPDEIEEYFYECA